MADTLEFKLEGLDSLLGKLDAVAYDVKYKGGRFALRKAAQLVAAKATENAQAIDDPETADSIARNIALRWNGRLFKSTGDLGFRVGVLGGARTYAGNKENVRAGRAGDSYTTDGSKSNPGGDTFYWRFVEFGTSRSRAQPFMRKALADNIAAATAAFVSEYDKALDRAIKRAAKKAAQG